jgi:hypothetical protein
LRLLAGLDGEACGLNSPESADGIWISTFCPAGFGSESSTIGNTTATIATNTIAPTKRRRARFLSCSSSSLIGLAKG